MRQFKTKLEITAAILTIAATLLSVGYFALSGGRATTSDHATRSGQTQASSASRTDASSVKASWHSLFNGRDLSGWSESRIINDVSKPTFGDWTVQDGSLVCVAEETGTLVSTGEYSDFILDLEFQLPDGNAGFIVGLRVPLKPQRGEKPPGVPVARESLLLELLRKDPNGGDQRLVDAAIEIGKRLEPAGQWNTLEIRCEANQLEAIINGTVVITTLPLADAYPSGALVLFNPLGWAKGTAFRSIRIRQLE